MILNDAQLVAGQTHSKLVLLKKTSAVCILQMEPQDSFQEVLDLLTYQEKPILLLLPMYGDAFSQIDHFLLLRQHIKRRKHPPFLCLIIPAKRVKEALLAAQCSIQHAPSVEEGLHSLPLYTSSAVKAPHSKELMEQELQYMKLSDQRKEARNRTIRSLQNTFISKKHRYLIGACLAFLLVISTIITWLLVFAPISPPSSNATTPPVGALGFTSSEQLNPDLTQGYNDSVALRLQNIPLPPTGMAYYAWLMPDQADDSTVPLLLGTFQVGPVNLTYKSSDHKDLLASYSGVRITVQANSSLPTTPSQDPKMWKWEGFVPNVPAPNDPNHYSLLAHLRHLLAKDPTLQANKIPGGLDPRLTQNAAKIEEWTSAAQGQWHGAQTTDGDAALIHRQMLRTLDYLDGHSYVWQDVPPGSEWLVDPLAGKLGLLSRVQNQEPPAYLPHVDMHLNGLAYAPGHTKEQQQTALMIDAAIQRMSTSLQRVREDAMVVVKMNTQQMKQTDTQTRLDEMANLSTEVKSGWFDSQTGENIGGALWINSWLQQLAIVPITVIPRSQQENISVSSY